MIKDRPNENNDVIKSIDGVLYYKYDYTDFLYQKLEDFKSRVNKAIKLAEPLSEWGECTINGKILKEIIDILKGDDKNEK